MIDYLLSDTVTERLRAAVEHATDLHAPALADIEIASAVRRLLRERRISSARAQQLIRDYGDLPLSRHGHLSLLARILDLRDSFSAYDAAYVALAEQLGGALLTSDAALMRAVRTARGVAVTIAD